MIPDFQSIMLPLLNSFKEGEIKSSKELRFNMVNHFNITENKLGVTLKQNYKIFNIDSDYFIED